MVDDPTHRNLIPPRAATRLISIAASIRHKDSLMGDLAEEFSSLAQTSPVKARQWYWQQAFLSVPQLLLDRMRSPSFYRFILTAAAAVIGYLAMQLWDANVSRKAAGVFHQMMNADSYGPARIMYFGVQTLGFALTGAAIAMITFVKENSLLQNALYRLGPSALILFAPFLYSLVASSGDYPAGIRILQLSLFAPAFIAGACLGNALRSS